MLPDLIDRGPGLHPGVSEDDGTPILESINVSGQPMTNENQCPMIFFKIEIETFFKMNDQKSMRSNDQCSMFNDQCSMTMCHVKTQETFQ